MVEQTICSKFFFVGQLLLVATWFSNVEVADGMTEKQMDARCSYISEAVDCSAEGECYSGMCSCRNGASTYPVCQTNPGGTGCGGKCGYTEYCDKKMGKCMCLHGGKPGNCCKWACASGRSCLNGRCRCKYGRLPQSRECRKCKPGTPGCKAPLPSLSCENSIRVTCSQYRDVSQQLQINITKVEQQVKQLEKEITLEKENCKKNSDFRGCPANWRGYKNAVYKFFNTAKTWKDAEATCNSFGSAVHLVSIQSSAEAARVSHFLPSTTKDIWTGGFRARGGKRPWNGMWTWTDGSAFKYTNWGRGEPNYNLGVEYYIQISDVGRKNYWNDFPDRNRLPFVCKCRLQ